MRVGISNKVDVQRYGYVLDGQRYVLPSYLDEQRYVLLLNMLGLPF
jgi:hypothetical protein